MQRRIDPVQALRASLRDADAWCLCEPAASLARLDLGATSPELPLPPPDEDAPSRPLLLGPPPGGRRNLAMLEDLLLMGDGTIRCSVLDHLWQDEARSLRAASKACREAVAAHPWSDFDAPNNDYLYHSFGIRQRSMIRGRVSSWRACYPRARAANINFNDNVTDADFVHLRGLDTLSMSGCWQEGITDAAFAHLEGIHTLDMSYCKQSTITDAAFVHLRGIHELSIDSCDQDTITDAAFVHLRGIHTLYMESCTQETITDAAFVHLQGIHALFMEECYQDTITDAAIVNLRGIHTLNISRCQQITGVTLENLQGISDLSMHGCGSQFTDAQLVHLRGIKRLHVCHCPQLTEAALAALGREVHIKWDTCYDCEVASDGEIAESEDGDGEQQGEEESGEE